MAVKQRTYKIGEFLSLDWDLNEPPTLHVRGHVEPDEFAKAYNAYHYGPEEPQAPPPDAAVVVYEYGRWAIGTDYMEGSWRRYLKTYPVSGAGRFPLTTVPYKAMQRDPEAVAAYEAAELAAYEALASNSKEQTTI